MAAKHATTTVPIVAVNVSNPVETGLVASLAKPGGNVAALANNVPGVEAKYVEVLRQIVPRVVRVVALVEVDNPALVASWGRFRTAAESTGVHAERIDLRSARELETAFETDAIRGAQALISFANPILQPVNRRLADLAVQHHLATISGTRLATTTGLLMSYNANTAATARRAAVYVDKILKGAKPADLPVEQPTVFDLVVNQTTAQARKTLRR